MKRNIVKMSLVAAVLLTTGSYASSIKGADVSSGVVRTDNIQFGYYGLNMDNINVNLIAAEGNTITGSFGPIDGSYPDMLRNDSFESNVLSTDGTDTLMGYVHQKPWPLSEPMGLKVINNDDQKNGKPVNCIMGSSYLATDDLENGATPVLCSSDAGTNKRFSLALLQNTVEGVAAGAYGKPVELVFDLADTADMDETITRYQVFQKVNNFTETRLDGIKVEVVGMDGNPHPELSLSLGINERTKEDGNGVITIEGDLFTDYEMAFYPPGLWGDNAEKPHLPPIGWYGDVPSGYLASVVIDEYNNTIVTEGDYPDGTYPALFGKWIPDQWVAYGVHEVDQEDPNAEAELIAYWGTTPDENFATDEPGWHYGYEQDFATPSDADLAKWAASPNIYPILDIEDLPNLSLNFIVEVGQAAAITEGQFILRFTPKVADTNTPPSYMEYESNGDRILPTLPTVDDGSGDGSDDIVIDIEGDDDTTASSGGGGCTYNPNSNSFDMTFLMMIAVGLLYPFRRRFIK